MCQNTSVSQFSRTVFICTAMQLRFNLYNLYCLDDVHSLICTPPGLAHCLLDDGLDDLERMRAHMGTHVPSQYTRSATKLPQTATKLVSQLVCNGDSAAVASRQPAAAASPECVYYCAHACARGRATIVRVNYIDDTDAASPYGGGVINSCTRRSSVLCNPRATFLFTQPMQ